MGPSELDSSSGTRAIADLTAAIERNPRQAGAYELSGRADEAAAYRAFLKIVSAGQSAYAAEAKRLLAEIERQRK